MTPTRIESGTITGSRRESDELDPSRWPYMPAILGQTATVGFQEADLGARLSAELAASVAEDRISGQTIAEIVNWLRGQLSVTARRSFGWQGDEVAEVAAWSALDAVIRALQQGVAETKSPERLRGYLVTAARHRLIDEIRIRARRPETVALDEANPPASLISTDDGLADAFSPGLSSEALIAALQSADRRGDLTAIRVVNEWLRLAEQDGRAPSLAAVGRELDLTGPGVRHILDRFASYFRSGAVGS